MPAGSCCSCISRREQSSMRHVRRQLQYAGRTSTAPQLHSCNCCCFALQAVRFSKYRFLLVHGWKGLATDATWMHLLMLLLNAAARWQRQSPHQIHRAFLDLLYVRVTRARLPFAVHEQLD
jgi:hypothetical protein